jgi:hypothetical protein
MTYWNLATRRIKMRQTSTQSNAPAVTRTTKTSTARSRIKAGGRPVDPVQQAVREIVASRHEGAA